MSLFKSEMFFTAVKAKSAATDMYLYSSAAYSTVPVSAQNAST